MRILLDTSFIVDMFRYRIDMAQIFDLFPGAKLATVPQVADELRKMAGKGSTHGRYAKVAVQLMGNIEVVEAPGNRADDALAKLAGKESIVATNDGGLRKRIAGRGFKTIYLRGRKQLDVS